jgi:cytochrome b subunit of formate dehydrogenase
MPRDRSYLQDRLLPLVFVLLTLPLALTPASAQESGCQDCHDDVTVAAAPHGDFDCSDCHSNVSSDDHPDDPLAELGGAAICAQCHDVGEALQASSHKDQSCEDCHGPAHAVTPVDDPQSPLSPLQQFKTCGKCHDKPADLVPGYLASVHAKALLVDGLANAPTCSTCHGSHDILPPDDAQSTVSHHNVPETCGSCHRFILDTWEKSTHGQEWTKGNADAPVCITCHTAHQIVPPMSAQQRLKTPDNCGNCHEERYSTYRDSFHGKATDIGFMTAATCSDCHTAHLNLPASDPQSSIAPANLPKTCGACHDNVTASFITFDPHSDPQSPSGDPKLHAVWLFMTLLLVGVFGFFGLHDALWLQRAVVGVVRGEIRRVTNGGPYIRRFTTVQIWIHAIIIVTFLTLAATGLPLKFHQSAWASTLADLFGGPGVARVLHRLAAIATFGYFLFHLARLIVRSFVWHEKGLFWGWKSMVPRGKDFADIWHNLKYFLYVGKRPKIDRWAYWEKFDYFAVFWGVVIIGTSGLILWFPTLAARLLPGWALNAAYIVHSDEALLAVGFIFIFHFFHTHLRPESFPLDPVIFTGSMPLEKFKEERPFEYERLVASGQLESVLVERPARGQVRIRYAWGFLALFIGLLLIAAILYSMIA